MFVRKVEAQGRLGRAGHNARIRGLQTSAFRGSLKDSMLITTPARPLDPAACQATRAEEGAATKYKI
jgi:hypothetical protein